MKFSIKEFFSKCDQIRSFEISKEMYLIFSDQECIQNPVKRLRWSFLISKDIRAIIQRRINQE